MARDRRRMIVRAALVAVLVVLLAVTPLSAIFRPAYFEVLFPSHGVAVTHRVVVDDRTGLVAGISPVKVASRSGVANGPDGNRRVLIVSLSGGCGDYLTWLTFESVGDGYRIERRTTSFGCRYLVLVTRRVAIHLRAPVDASTVESASLNPL